MTGFVLGPAIVWSHSAAASALAYIWHFFYQIAQHVVAEYRKGKEKNTGRSAFGVWRSELGVPSLTTDTLSPDSAEAPVEAGLLTRRLAQAPYNAKRRTQPPPPTPSKFDRASRRCAGRAGRALLARNEGRRLRRR